MAPPPYPGAGRAIGLPVAPVSFETVRSRYPLLDSLDLESMNSLFEETAVETFGTIREAADLESLASFRSAFLRGRRPGESSKCRCLPSRSQRRTSVTWRACLRTKTSGLQAAEHPMEAAFVEAGSECGASGIGIGGDSAERPEIKNCLSAKEKPPRLGARRPGFGRVGPGVSCRRGLPRSRGFCPPGRAPPRSCR